MLAREIHRIWARKTWVAIHHTNSGLRAYCDAYVDDFQTEVVHLVIPHGLSRYTADEVARARLELNSIEAEMGIQPVPSGGLRIGIFGSSRRERLTRMAMEAFASSRRDDLQLAVFSLGPDDRVPKDSRIFAQMKTGGYSPDYAFIRTLALADVFWLPFREHGMLTSGIPSNALEAGRPSLASSWFYTEEYLGRSAIPCGNSKIAFTRSLDTLGFDRVREATEVANRIRDQLWWEHIAPRTVFAYEIAESMRVFPSQRDRLRRTPQTRELLGPFRERSGPIFGQTGVSDEKRPPRATRRM
jgi:hypothetical protein